MRIDYSAFFALAVLFSSIPKEAALALEVECPLFDPGNPSDRLLGGGSTEDVPEDPGGNVEVRRGDRWHATNLLEKWGKRDADLECIYSGQKIVTKIPGLLLRCDWLGRDVLRPQPYPPDTGGPLETVFLRIWCTSRP